MDDNLCANDAQFANLVSEQLNFSMLKIREKLNERAITWLNANRSANVDTSRGTGSWVTAASATTIPVADFDNQNLLTRLGIIAAGNRMGNDWLILDGTNMLISKNIAPYLGLNDDQRSFGAIYGDISMRYNADQLDMDRVIGAGANTFMVNPNMFGFHSSTSYSRAPQVLDSSKNQQAFRIADPVLRYRRTSLQGDTPVTELVPVEYDVVYEKSCTGTDALGKRVFRHLWEVSLVGGMHLGPAANSGHTNIIKFLVSYA